MSVLRKREEMTRKEADTSAREKGLQLQVRSSLLLDTCSVAIPLLLFVLQRFCELCVKLIAKRKANVSTKSTAAVGVPWHPAA